jgi:hypothetical protein
MLKTIIIASSLLIGGAAFAQSQQNQGPETPVQAAPGTSNGATTTAPSPSMQERNVGMPRNNTGNTNTKGAGKGTTGTGGPGGSGNE